MAEDNRKGKGRGKKAGGTAVDTPKYTGGVRSKLDGYAHAIPGEGNNNPTSGKRETLIGGVAMDMSGGARSARPKKAGKEGPKSEGINLRT